MAADTAAMGSRAPAREPVAQRAVLLLATLATGLAAGFFYAYEVSVTRGLAAVDDRTYVEAMQAINEAVRNFPFALSFFGALVALTGTVVLHLHHGSKPVRGLVIAALVLYAAAFVVTAAVNVPLNRELAEASTLAANEVSSARADYEGTWRTWNLVRTLLSTAALGALAGALLLSRPGRRGDA